MSAALLKTWRGTRPLLALMGPWVIGGDINSAHPKAAHWRDRINKTTSTTTTVWPG